MKSKSKISQREVWLLALLPAALVVIVSFALPSPADEVAELEQRLDQMSSNEEQTLNQLREYSDQLKQNNQEIESLEAREADLSSQIRLLNRPKQRRQMLDLADALDELARRLSKHGAQVLAMEASDQGTVARGVKQSDSRSGAEQREWVVSLVATWPVLRTALADPQAFPLGLALSAMKMESVPSSGVLRRWELVVTVSEQSP
ncbi:MAG: hypothetical protein AAF085_09895 [Planctomycetota bacterium]